MPSATSSKRSTSFRSRRDRAVVAGALIAGVAAGSLVVLIVAFVALEAAPALAAVGPTRFLTDPAWHPRSGLYGVAPMLAATVLTSALSIAIATPLGIGSALFRRFYAPPVLATGFHRLLELAAGIPSVVYGLWGLVTLVPLIAAVRPPGQSLLAAVAILTLMILPTVALTADAAMTRVPAEQLQAAAALGLGRATTLLRIVLPGSRAGIATGVLLALGRALGETMAVLMVCGNVVLMPRTPFDPIRPITANIALEMAYATAEHRSVLFATGLALMILVAIWVTLAELLSGDLEAGLDA